MARRDSVGFKKNEVLFRDDQIDPLRLTDEIRRAGKGGRKVALLDSGVFGLVEMEWLAKEGLHLYTSDEAGRSGSDLLRISEDIDRGGGRVYYFHRGAWDEELASGRLSFADILNAGRSGIDIHVSNREYDRDPSRLCELARACAEGGACLVYYHAGPLRPWIEDLARCGAWIHLTEGSLSGAEDILIVKDAAVAARRGGFNIILHVPAVRDVSWIRDLIETGIVILWETPPSDYRSPLRELEAAAKKARLRSRMYYLDPTFLP